MYMLNIANIENFVNSAHEKKRAIEQDADFRYNAHMVWVIGSTGMLGAEVCGLLQKNKVQFAGTSSDVDARDYKALKSFADKWERENYLAAHQKGTAGRIQWIVNCSAYTAVEKAQNDKKAAQELNADAARNIARVAREIGAKLIHISTDYVFDGTANSPYKESDTKNPLGVYGQTKSDGEDEIHFLALRLRPPKLCLHNGQAHEYKRRNQSGKRPEGMPHLHRRLGGNDFAYNKKLAKGGIKHFQQGDRSLRHLPFYGRGRNDMV